MEPLARTRAAISANPLVVDTAIAVFLAALSLLAYVGAAPYVGPLSPVTLVLLLLESLPLIVRRRFPLAVLGVIAGASIVHLGLLTGRSVTHGGPGHPRRGLHRRRACRPPDVAHGHGADRSPPRPRVRRAGGHRGGRP